MHQDSQVTFPSHGPEGRFYDTALLVEWLNRHCAAGFVCEGAQLPWTFFAPATSG